MNEPLAHSPRPPVEAQTYADHILSVERAARANAARAFAFHTGERGSFVEDVATAAAYHDFGKLDDQNQAVLRQVSRQGLPVAHEDAGVVQLLAGNRPEAALLVRSHHAGLFDSDSLREAPYYRSRRLGTIERVDDQLASYVHVHGQAGCPTVLSLTEGQLLHESGLDRRLALSCLVDADHGDTARHYGSTSPEYPETRWTARLEALNRYVGDLKGTNAFRDRQRSAVYEACRQASLEPRMRACEAPVGTGKTTAVMAHLLNVAVARGLRHIFVVLPFVNIVKQSVETYRNAMVLPDENPEAIVAEHDHQADFQDLELRQLATLWRAPIIVTTAVQFFETLGAARTSRLRKLHELAGSAVFVDETHAAIPAHLWPQMWLWLEAWTEDWGGHVVFASGSLARFWEVEDFVQPPKGKSEVPDLVPADLRTELAAAERRRAEIIRVDEPFALEQLIEFVVQKPKPGPRLVILNTVQSAAVLAFEMRRVGHDVLHLSTALTPRDRAMVLGLVERRLEDSEDRDWTLVATSCVEAGLNISFRSGFREDASMASTLQVAGRIGRSGEYDDARVWVFRINDPQRLPDNPTLEVPQRALWQLLQKPNFNVAAPGALALDAMQLQFTQGDADRAEALRQVEQMMRYPEGEKMCRVIDQDTRIVVIEQSLADLIENGEDVPTREFLKDSVQIWGRKLDKLPVSILKKGRHPSETVYRWNGDYSAGFLGYMEWFVRNQPAGSDAPEIIV